MASETLIAVSLSLPSEVTVVNCTEPEQGWLLKCTLQWCTVLLVKALKIILLIGINIKPCKIFICQQTNTRSVFFPFYCVWTKVFLQSDAEWSIVWRVDTLLSGILRNLHCVVWNILISSHIHMQLLQDPKHLCWQHWIAMHRWSCHSIKILHLSAMKA